MKKISIAFVVAAVALVAAGTAHAQVAEQVYRQAQGTCNNLSAGAGVGVINTSQATVTTTCRPLSMPYNGTTNTRQLVAYIERPSVDTAVTCRLFGYDQFNATVFFTTETTGGQFSDLFQFTSLPVSVYFVSVSCDVPAATAAGPAIIVGFSGFAG